MDEEVWYHPEHRNVHPRAVIVKTSVQTPIFNFRLIFPVFVTIFFLPIPHCSWADEQDISFSEQVCQHHTSVAENKAEESEWNILKIPESSFYSKFGDWSYERDLFSLVCGYLLIHHLSSASRCIAESLDDSQNVCDRCKEPIDSYWRNHQVHHHRHHLYCDPEWSQRHTYSCTGPEFPPGRLQVLF